MEIPKWLLLKRSAQFDASAEPSGGRRDTLFTYTGASRSTYVVPLSPASCMATILTFEVISAVPLQADVLGPMYPVDTRADEGDGASARMDQGWWLPQPGHDIDEPRDHPVGVATPSPGVLTIPFPILVR